MTELEENNGHLNKLKSLKVAKLKDEGCNEVSGEGKYEGVMKLILSYLRGFAVRQTDK